MTKKRKLIGGASVFTAAIIPIGIVASCGGSTSATYTVKAKDENPKYEGTKIQNKKLAVMVSDPENPRWQRAKEDFEINGKAAGFDTTVGIAKLASDQSNWLQQHSNDDAWIIGASDDTAFGAATKRTSQQPVIAYDRLVKTANRTSNNWYVTYDNSRVGAYQGLSILSRIYNHNLLDEANSKTLAELQTLAVNYAKAHPLKEDKTILSLGGDPADNNAHLFFDGGANIIKAVSVVDSRLSMPAPFNDFNKVAQKGWDYNAGRSFLDTQLSKLSAGDKKKIAGVLSPNDGMATSAIQALKASNLDPKNIYITGQDSNDSAIKSIYFKTGQDMTIFKPDTKASAAAVAIARVLLDNPTLNVEAAAGTIGGKTVADVTQLIKSEFPSLDFTIDITQYTTNGNKAINTILLSPQIINYDNVKKFFDITKN